MLNPKPVLCLDLSNSYGGNSSRRDVVVTRMCENVYLGIDYNVLVCGSKISVIISFYSKTHISILHPVEFVMITKHGHCVGYHCRHEILCYLTACAQENLKLQGELHSQVFCLYLLHSLHCKGFLSSTVFIL